MPTYGRLTERRGNEEATMMTPEFSRTGANAVNSPGVSLEERGRLREAACESLKVRWPSAYTDRRNFTDDAS